MMMADPTILTIILNYRTPDMTLQAAEAALREMEGVNGEIVIVDNGSDDGSFQKLSEQAEARGWTRDTRLRVVESGWNGGFGAGMNFGMRSGLSTGEAADFCYLLNSDAFPDPGAIRILRDFLVANPRAGIASSYVHGIDGEPHRTAFRFPTIASEFEGAAHTGLISRVLAKSAAIIPIPDQTCAVDWAAGASMMIRGDMLDEIGGFDEVFFLYFEETDLCLRAARAGWSTHYVRESAIAHVGSVSTGMKDWHRTPAFWFDSRLHYFVKNHGVAYAALATVAWVSGNFLWQVRRVITRKPPRNRPGFMRDLISHSVRAIFQRPKSRHLPNPAKTVAED